MQSVLCLEHITRVFICHATNPLHSCTNQPRLDGWQTSRGADCVVHLPNIAVHPLCLFATEWWTRNIIIVHLSLARVHETDLRKPASTRKQPIITNAPISSYYCNQRREGNNRAPKTKDYRKKMDVRGREVSRTKTDSFRPTTAIYIYIIHSSRKAIRYGSFFA